MKIVMIGSGNLATQLSLALKDAGREIVQVYSRTGAHAQELAEQTLAVTVQPPSRPSARMLTCMSSL